jgi:chaperonin GroEL
VAKISANGDEDIARVVSDAVLRVGVEGAISIGMAQSTRHQLEMVEGLQIDSGLAHPFFVNDAQRNRAVYDNCLVFISDRRISTQAEALKIMEKAVKVAHEDENPFALLVIANDIDPEALGTFVGNKVKNNVSVVAVTSPAWGPARRDLLEDVALITKGDRIDGPKGENYAQLSGSAFGHAARVVVTQQKTVITGLPIDEFDRKKNLEPYIARVRALSEDKELHPADQDRAKQRLAALTGGVAVVKVGGNSGGEVKERGFRVEDAIHATRAAVADGIVPGGGSALLFANIFLEETMKDAGPLTGTQMGAHIILEAITAPMLQIVRNAGHEDPESVLDNLQLNAVNSQNFKGGFDASSMTFVDDMIAAGIVDPLKVVRSSLNAAATAAAQLLLTEGVIALEAQA